MRKKIIAFLILFVIFIVGVFVLVYKNKSKDNQSVAIKQEEQKKIRIVACPTCFGVAKNINTDKYEIIKTASTAESLTMLENKKADMILAGRTLKPDEPQMDKILVKEGYSFLSDKETTIYTDQLKSQTIYTDLDIETVRNFLPSGKINKVADVYDYLNKGIVVTSWENTDYKKARIVHVLKENGERFELSRRPTIYCPNVCGKEAQEIALLIK